MMLEGHEEQTEELRAQAAALEDRLRQLEQREHAVTQREGRASSPLIRFGYPAIAALLGAGISWGIMQQQVIVLRDLASDLRKEKLDVSVYVAEHRSLSDVVSGLGQRVTTLDVQEARDIERLARLEAKLEDRGIR